MARIFAHSRTLLLLLAAAVMLSPALVATSAEAKPTAYRVGINLSDTNIVAGDDVRISGQVRPLTTGNVTIQQRVAGVWKKLRTTKLVASGYATTLRFNDPGVTFLRVVKAGGQGHKQGISKTRTVRVVNNATNPQISTVALPAGSVGVAYSATVQVADGRAGVWSISQGALPPGLTIAPATGVISGTPTAKGTSQFGVFFTDTDGRVAGKILSIAIDETAAEQLIVTTALPNGVKGTAYTGQLKSKDDRPGTWSITAGALPAGLTLNATTGAITGTPTTVGKADFTVRFQDAQTNASTKALSITVTDTSSNPVIATTALPSGVAGVPYAAQLFTADNRTGTWSITAGTLPTGLTLTAATGVISGTPTTAAIRDFTVKFTDGAGLSATKDFSIIIEATAPEIITTTLPAAAKGVAYSAELKTKDGRAGAWNVSSGTLPAGLTLNAATGVISGTPTTTGTSAFQVKFRDTLGVSDTQDLSIVVSSSPPVISTTSLPKGKTNTAYTATLKTADNRAGTWSISAGTLPPGLTLAPATGVISGTPTERGTSNFTVKFKDADGVEVTKALSIQVQSCLLIICV